jgi:hypothetical protein
MKITSCKIYQRGKRSILWPAFAMLVLLIAAAPGGLVLADAPGGFPTLTPTVLPTPTPTALAYPIPTPMFMPTPTPPSPSLLFPPTPTFTPVVPGFVQELAAPQVQNETTTQTADGPLFSLLTCLPFALIVGLLGTVGFYWIRSRARPPTGS